MTEDQTSKYMKDFDSLDPTWRDFWKLSLFKKNNKPIYKFFTHDGFSLWWGFKEEFFRLGQMSSNSYRIKEISRDLIDNYLRKSGSIEEKADIALVNTAVVRPDMKYFGSIPSLLKSSGHSPLEILVYYPGFGKILSYLSKKQSDTHYIYSFQNQQAINTKKQAKKHSAQIYAELSGPEIEDFYKTYFTKKQAAFFRTFVKNCCDFYYPRAVWYYELYNEMIRKTKPKIFVNFAICSLYVYPGISAAKKHNLSIAYLQPGGIGGEFFHPDNFLTKNSVDGGMILPDRYFVFNVSDKNGHPFSNINKDSITVAGSPRFDCYVDYANPSKEFINKIKHKYGFPANKKLMIWTPHIAAPHYKHKDEDGQTLNILLEFLNNHPEYHLIIKLHPDESVERMIGNYSKLSDKRISVFGKGSNADELLVLADFTIVSASTMAVQSILLNTPVLLCTVVYPDPQPGLKKDGFDLIVSNSEDIEDNLKLINSEVYKKKFNKLRNKFITRDYPNLGSSSDIIAKELINLLKTTKNKF